MSAAKIATAKTNAALPLDQISLPDLKKLANFLAESGLEELEIELGPDFGGGRISLRRPSSGQVFTAAPASSPAPVAAASATSSTPAANAFPSPMVGTLYHAASPDSAPFVKIGDAVKAGQTLCIIEAMKTMNQIESDRAGTIAEILTPNATPVEFGQPLFIIK